jgi:hypothetical protein
VASCRKQHLNVQLLLSERHLGEWLVNNYAHDLAGRGRGRSRANESASRCSHPCPKEPGFRGTSGCR